MHPRLAPYPDVAAILSRLQQEAQQILGPQLFGLYLTGSLALGDFDLARSDIDFMLVTQQALEPDLVTALCAMHARLSSAPSKWGRELEGSYVPHEALRRIDLHGAVFPHIERGGELAVEQHDSDWLILCHVLYEHGFALAGPPPQTLLAPLSPHALRRAVLDLLWWWELQLEDTSRVAQGGYRAYAILTMCRIFYTMEHGAVVSKPTAARWARQRLQPRWAALITQALHWQPGAEPGRLPEALDFIRYTLSAVR